MSLSWLDIAGRVIVVSGGSSGIGAAIIEQLCEQGVHVVNADLERGSYRHGNLLFVKTDVASRDSVNNMLAAGLQKFGTLDGLVNNAGISMPALLVDEGQGEKDKIEINDDIFDRMVAVNQKGVYLMSQAVGRELVKKRAGVIVNISAESGLEGSEGQSIYAATKAAVNSFTRSWAKELGKKGIRVIGLAPGVMEETDSRTLDYERALAYTRGISIDELRAGYAKTSTIPLGRSGRLTEVADAVSYFISDRSSYITGVTLNIAGGKTRG